MDFDKKLIGNRIVSERKKIGLTQEELAIKLGLKNKSSICQYENGDAIPSDDIKIQMSKIFDCSIDYLLGKTDVRDIGKQIDDVLNEAMIGMSKEEYNALNETQKKQIRDFALFVKNQVDNEKK